VRRQTRTEPESARFVASDGVVAEPELDNVGDELRSRDRLDERHLPRDELGKRLAVDAVLHLPSFSADFEPTRSTRGSGRAGRPTPGG